MTTEPTMSLAPVLAVLGLSQRSLARSCRVTKSVVNRIVLHNEWPKNDTDVRAAMQQALLEAGASKEQLLPLYSPFARNKRKAPVGDHPAEAAPQVPVFLENPKEFPMLLESQALTEEALKHFELPRNPFIDDVESTDDVFQSGNVRYVRRALEDCALNHGFVAVTGESGAGKSTLAEDLEERLRAGRRNVLVIRHYVLGMEENDTKGKTLKASHIAEALVQCLDPSATIESSPQKRFKQLHNLLVTSRSAGNRHLVLIEEAHCMPKVTLKHLKRFLELKDGMRRLLGVALIAQPELRSMLSSNDAQIREVRQRCQMVELQPLDNDLEAYLKFKFARFDLKYEQVFAKDAADAIRARLIWTPRGGKAADAKSICYPLVVNNLVCKAMNAAAALAYPQVDGQTIAGC